MSEHDVKEVMEQIHISEKMREEIVVNVKDQMENGRSRTRNWRKMATVAAALVLLTGIGGISVKAVVENVVRERMEKIPEEEVQALNEVVQNKTSDEDLFSRAFSEEEAEREKTLWQAYGEGTFPEGELLQVDQEEEVIEGTLCYVKTTGMFYLPDRALTDEELLEIIDLQHMMRYAVSQTPEAQAEQETYQEEQEQRREQIQDADGISEEDAIQIATERMQSELGAAAEGKELKIVFLDDISEADYGHTGEEAYVIAFGNDEDHSTYTCAVDAVDGSILYTVAH
ncbi:MAG: hypothetical protein NC417_10465 [Candidatus Gastranaerophilales bacterium]|nr:hypothetical protein [Candidatus Gastranaerophilales bacterium]